MKKGRPEKPSKHVNDLTGQQFDRLKVLRFSESKKSRGSMCAFWICECLCGKIIEKSNSYLIREDRPHKSCGCVKPIRSIIRFHSLYEKSEGCWNWKGILNDGGYGKWNGSTASRQAWIYAFGKIPRDKQVCHTCDNRRCVNLAHLFLGTIGDNMRDRTSKNRQAKGSRIANAILSEEKVLEIRATRLANASYKELAEKYGISWYLVRSICKNRQWKHVALGEECRLFISSHDNNKSQHTVLQ